MQQQEWHGHTDIGVHLRNPRRPELGTEVRVPRWWKADSVPIHSANNILYLLSTRPFEAVGQMSKATVTSGSHACARIHTSTGSLVSSSYLAMVSQAQLSGPLLRIQIFSSDSYVVKEGAAISITSLGHALSSSTTLGAQLPWFWLLHLSSMTFLLLPFLFIYLYPEFAHNQSTLWLLLMVNLLSLQMSILRCWGEKIFLQITKRVKTQCAQLLVLWILYLNRLDNY